MAFSHPPHPLSALPATHSLTRGGAPGPHFSSVTNYFLKKECGRGQQELKYGSQFQPSSAPACVVLAGLPGPQASPALSKGCRWDKSSAAGGGGWGRALWGPHWGPSPLRTIKPTRALCLSAQRCSPVPALWEHRSVYRQLVLRAVNDRADPPLPPTMRWNVRPDGSHLDPGSTKLTLPASPLAENILPSLPPTPQNARLHWALSLLSSLPRQLPFLVSEVTRAPVPRLLLIPGTPSGVCDGPQVAEIVSN